MEAAYLAGPSDAGHRSEPREGSAGFHPRGERPPLRFPPGYHAGDDPHPGGTMTHRLRRCAALALVALAGAALPAEPAPAPSSWLELESQSFVLRTDLPAVRARALLRQLELLRALLLKAMFDDAPARPGRLEVVA